MQSNPGRALIIANLSKEDAGRTAREIGHFLREHGHSVDVHAFSGKPDEAPAVSGSVLAVSLGGDGTVLYSARITAPWQVPVFPVNLGSLGFIAWIRKGEWRHRLEQCLAGSLMLSERVMLDVEVVRQGRTEARFTALNEGVVSGSGSAKILDLRVAVSGVPFCSYRSDGAIVATPTGSTAYSLAAGGPILEPDLDAIVFIPICPFTLSNRPLVLPGSEEIEVNVADRQRSSLVLTVDGQEFFDLAPGDRVLFRRSPAKARIYCAGRATFYDVLRHKLNWSGGPDA
ncbi:MAG TPA: NAD(+)/NADH kinase [Magnetospirillaceae bacterium]|nr:NAD(+)/NADH kinase [Magnetospirillaceae bacterium]